MIKKLSNPRVRRRLKIGLSVWAGVILIGLTFKLGYDIGHFNAQSLKEAQNSTQTNIPPALTMQAAQRIVSGALKEDPLNQKTIVAQIIDDNYKLSAIVVENSGLKKVAWIIDTRLFVMADLFNDQGYNLTEGIEQQHNITRADH